MTIPAELVEKLRRIQTLAERAGTPEEGAAAAAKMSALMLKYNLSMVDVESFSQSPESEVVMNVLEIKSDRYRQNLLWAVAPAFSCMAILMPGIRKGYGRMMIVGHIHNVPVVEQTWRWLVGLADAMSLDAWKRLDRWDRRDYPSADVYRRSWKSGFSAAIRKSYVEMMKSVEKEVDAATWAIVPVMKDEVKKQVDTMFGDKLETVRREEKVYQRAYLAGREAGASVNVQDRQISPTGADLQLR